MNLPSFHASWRRCVLVLMLVLAIFGVPLPPVGAQALFSAGQPFTMDVRGSLQGTTSAAAWTNVLGRDAGDGRTSAYLLEMRGLQAGPGSQTGHARLVLDPNVTPEDQELITEAVRLAEDVFTTRFGVSPGNAVTVTALPIAAPRNEGRIAATVGDSMVIYTGSPGWIESPPAERVRIVVHEYTHIYQHSKTEAVPDESAAWFEEGVAEYLSMVALSELGLMDRAAIEGLFGEIVHHTELPPLEELEELSALYAQPGQVYPLAYFAVAQLLQDRPLSSIDVYYTALQQGEPFADAFELAFGITPQRFYEEFAQFRASGLPTMGYLPAELDIAEGVDQPSAVTAEAAPVFVIPGQQALVIGDASPGSNCTLDLVVSDTTVAIEDRDTFANGAGRVFWLLTIPADVPPGQGSFVVTCGADPLSVPVLVM